MEQGAVGYERIIHTNLRSPHEGLVRDHAHCRGGSSSVSAPTSVSPRCCTPGAQPGPHYTRTSMRSCRVAAFARRFALRHMPPRFLLPVQLPRACSDNYSRKSSLPRMARCCSSATTRSSAYPQPYEASTSACRSVWSASCRSIPDDEGRSRGRNRSNIEHASPVREKIIKNVI